MPTKIPPELCVRCKGYKRLCGLPRCPILERFMNQVKVLRKIDSKELEGATPPSAVVGEKGYPNVKVYFMVPPGELGEEARYHDSPREWALRREPLSNIIALRTSLVSAIINSPVKDPWTLYEKEISLASVSAKPVDAEVTLKKTPIPALKFNGITKPIGPSSPAEKVKISDNPLLPRKLEKILWDDMKAEEAVIELYRSGIDVYSIERAMSLGMLGRLRERRLVPTRWAITAVDDIISKSLRKKVSNYEWIDSIEVKYGEYLGNRYMVIILPGPGSFEWIEIWHPRGLWTGSVSKPIIWRVFEDSRGTISTPDGGFSAARLAVLEGLSKIRRSANVVIIREIFPTYYAPVGNWHIRETVRNIMRKDGQRFNNVAEVTSYIKDRVTIDTNSLLKKSLFLRGLKQTRLVDY